MPPLITKAFCTISARIFARPPRPALIDMSLFSMPRCDALSPGKNFRDNTRIAKGIICDVVTARAHVARHSLSRALEALNTARRAAFRFAVSKMSFRLLRFDAKSLITMPRIGAPGIVFIIYYLGHGGDGDRCTGRYKNICFPPAASHHRVANYFRRKLHQFLQLLKLRRRIMFKMAWLVTARRRHAWPQPCIICHANEMKPTLIIIAGLPLIT